MRSTTASFILFVLICSSQHAFGQRYGHIAQPSPIVSNYNAFGSTGTSCPSCNAGTPMAFHYQGMPHQRVMYPGMCYQGACCHPAPCCSQGCNPCHSGYVVQRSCIGQFVDRLYELERRKNQWFFGGCRGFHTDCYNRCY